MVITSLVTCKFHLPCPHERRCNHDTRFHPILCQAAFRVVDVVVVARFGVLAGPGR